MGVQAPGAANHPHRPAPRATPPPMPTEGPAGLHPLTSESVTGGTPMTPRTRTTARREGMMDHPPVAAAARVAAIIVTWNRRTAVDDVLRALSHQEHPLSRMDVVVIDNASTDGTSDFLIERWRPEVVTDNPTSAAHQPDFRIQHRADRRAAGNAGGFSSLSIVKNAHNHGGCGGFNTGLAFVEQFLDSGQQPLDYVWLVDDDVDLPPRALTHLTRTAESDPQIGIVGSRTVDFADRATTTETTIYFDFDRGWMGPDPTPAHPMHADHQKWVERVGGTRGALSYSGVRDVDVVSACSLLARWSAVKEIGFWDNRYFIYCDDADWCLRFRARGYRVVCDLDAVVYHTYWLSKLTPARGYYSQRNLLWVIQKTLKGMALKKAMFRRLGAIIRQSFKAMTHCRLFHAEIIRRTAHDVVTGRGGRLDDTGPAAIPVMDALSQAGALDPGATVMVMCSHPESIGWADDLRAAVTHALLDRNQARNQPRWLYMVREDVSDPIGGGGGTANAQAVPQRIRFEPNRASKWRAQRPMLRCPPTAVIIFDQNNDFPLIHSRFNIHIERRQPDLAQPEADGLGVRIRFLLRLSLTAVRCALFAAMARQRPHAGKYG